MATTFTTPLMSLILPIVGSEPGPTWADDLNAAFQLIDSHNHSSGSGSLVPTSGLNINADLSFGGFNATSLVSTRFTSQSSALAGLNDKSCVYVVSGNLYYNNGSGTSIQLTSGSALNAASIGGIGGDYSTSTASVAYTNSTKTFTFTQSAGVTAKLAIGDLSIFENVSSAQGITIKSPTSLGSAYTLTLPTALPTTSQFLSCNTSGVLSYKGVNTLLSDAVIGSAAQVTSGEATHSTFSAAIAAISSNGTIKVLAGTYVENVSINKAVTITGAGYGSVISGTLTFASGSNDSLVQNLKITGAITINSGVQSVILMNFFNTTATLPVDNGTGNYIEGLQE